MATVTTPEPYTTGTTVTASHNSNIFGDSGAIGVLRGLDGNLSSTNLGSFSLQKDLIQPGGLIFFDMVPMKTSQLDYISEFMGSVSASEFIPVSGAALQFYLPYAVSWLEMDINVQVGQWIAADQGVGNVTDTAAWLTMYYDGASVTQHRTALHNWTTDEYPTGVPVLASTSSARSTRHLSFNYLIPTIAAGWHEIGLRVSVEKTTLIGPSIAASDATGATHSWNLFSRVTFYNRNVLAIGYK